MTPETLARLEALAQAASVAHGDREWDHDEDLTPPCEDLMAALDPTTVLDLVAMAREAARPLTVERLAKALEPHTIPHRWYHPEDNDECDCAVQAAKLILAALEADRG